MQTGFRGVFQFKSNMASLAFPSSLNCSCKAVRLRSRCTPSASLQKLQSRFKNTWRRGRAQGLRGSSKSHLVETVVGTFQHLTASSSDQMSPTESTYQLYSNAQIQAVSTAESALPWACLVFTGSAGFASGWIASGMEVVEFERVKESPRHMCFLCI